MKNKTIGAFGSSLVSLALATGCVNNNHTSFFARTVYNPENRAVNLEVADEAGIREVRIYRENKLVRKYNLKKFGNPSQHLIETDISEDGHYSFKLFGQNGETDIGFFEKQGEKVSPREQACF